MRTLRRYFLGRFFKVFLLLCVGFSLVISLLDLVDRLDELTPESISARLVLLYPLCMFPKYLTYLMPVAGLFAGLFTLGQAAKAKELVAVMASGGRLKLLLMPFVFTGLILSIIGFGIGEFIVPVTNKLARNIKNPALMKKYKSVSKEGSLWAVDSKGSIVHVDLYVPDRNLGREISIYKFDNNAVSERIEAREAFYEQEGWTLKNATVYDIAGSSMSRFDSLRFASLEAPKILNRNVEGPNEMGILELRAYVRRLNDAGLRNLQLAVDMQSRVSYPLVSLFMLTIGVSIAARREIGGLIASALGLGISLLYWVGYTLCLSMGYSGILSPWMSAWLMPFAFSLISIRLFASIKE